MKIINYFSKLFTSLLNEVSRKPDTLRAINEGAARAAARAKAAEEESASHPQPVRHRAAAATS